MTTDERDFYERRIAGMQAAIRDQQRRLELQEALISKLEAELDQKESDDKMTELILRDLLERAFPRIETAPVESDFDREKVLLMKKLAETELIPQSPERMRRDQNNERNSDES